jgi:hypothetical protein
MRSLPPFRHFVYVLGTVNVVMAVVLFLVSLAFNSGVNIVAMAFVLVVVNVVSAISVARRGLSMERSVVAASMVAKAIER